MNFVKSLCILNNLNFNLNHWSTCITTGPVMSVWLPLCVQLLTDSLLFLLNYIGLNFSPKIIFRPKLLERIFKYPVKVSVANLWNFINNFKMLTVKRTDLIQISTHLSLVIEPDLQASDILHCFSMRGITLINRVGRFNTTLSYISFLASHTSLLLPLRTGCSTENLLKWLTAKEIKMLIYCCILFPITIAPVQGLRDIL